MRSVLVKGSRFMRMERVVQGLLALTAPVQQEQKDSTMLLSLTQWLQSSDPNSGSCGSFST
ncbi:hypothetical protein Y695_03188 [Hydrogenophaga sp. T4]|nr:hypothetical protein Y695_03188 [Hydrogenophaga sp. T4]